MLVAAILLTAAWLLSATPAAAGGPMIGEPAPALSIGRWLGGTPVTGFVDGRVYVVDIWAPWCGPCLGGMPHLSDLEDRYRADGVTVIGLTGDDDYGATLEKAEAALAGLGPRVRYAVAWDSSRATYARWMEREGANGWPWCFVVDRDGRLAWTGHPERLDPVLDAVVRGAWNLDSAATAYRRHARGMDLAGRFYASYKAGRWRDALASWDTLRAFDEERAATYVPHAFKARRFGLRRATEARAFVRGAMATLLGARPQPLTRVATAILDASDPVMPADLDLALECAARADSLAGGADPGLAATRARALARKGRWDDSIAFQRRALERAAPEDRAAQAKVLAEYEAARAGRPVSRRPRRRRGSPASRRGAVRSRRGSRARRAGTGCRRSG